MRQWYQGKLAERLMQAAEMAKDRALLRRGSRKQQDGTLGRATPGSSGEGDEDMQIRIGDELHYHPPASQASAPPPATKPSLAAKLARWVGAGALGASGVGIPWAMTAMKATQAIVAPPPTPTVDTDTQYTLELVP
jgi:hypothetical protein